MRRRFTRARCGIAFALISLCGPAAAVGRRTVRRVRRRLHRVPRRRDLPVLARPAGRSRQGPPLHGPLPPAGRGPGGLRPAPSGGWRSATRPAGWCARPAAAPASTPAARPWPISSGTAATSQGRLVPPGKYSLHLPRPFRCRTASARPGPMRDYEDLQGVAGMSEAYASTDEVIVDYCADAPTAASLRQSAAARRLPGAAEHAHRERLRLQLLLRLDPQPLQLVRRRPSHHRLLLGQRLRQRHVRSRPRSTTTPATRPASTTG